MRAIAPPFCRRENRPREAKNSYATDQEMRQDLTQVCLVSGPGSGIGGLRGQIALAQNKGTNLAITRVTQEADCAGGVPLGNQDGCNAPQHSLRGPGPSDRGNKLFTGCPQHMTQGLVVQIRASEEGPVGALEE